MGTLSEIQTLLIANRGEIACRIARTAKKLGIRTVAVYSDADAGALHVRSCDVAVRIGPAATARSYLDSAAILAAAAETGADAIHPGYGFLSENAEFAESCERAGIRFVGPPAAAIRSMGLKAAAKSLMQKAGVPLTPGYHGKNQDAAQLKQEAVKIGFPVLIKASAGGGGKGMRRVDRAEDFDAALVSCKRESAASFGDDAVLIERYLVHPRHVEVQIFADSHGHCVSLFERDCSVQRRHQKVLEEAPAPGLTDADRSQMYAAAVAAAQAVGYVGAGTIEFIRAQSGEFYFMEMNTRLQVEHPVTEMITGLDLVEWQLRVAAGEPLPLTQADISQRGHAIEARVYAEDPARGFLPSTGLLHWFAQPEAAANVRVDAGVEQGDSITPFYDPMIAKVIVWDRDRAAAVNRMLSALAEVEIAGVSNNVDFLRRLVATDSFAHARLDTDLIEREHAALFESHETMPRNVLVAAAAAILVEERALDDGASAWAMRSGWRLQGAATRTLSFSRATGEGAPRHQDVLVRYGTSAFELTIDRTAIEVSAVSRGPSRYRLTIGKRMLDATVVRSGASFTVFVDGIRETLGLLDPFEPVVEADAKLANLRAPMPGKVIALSQPPGTIVAKGDPLLVMEAMKMEHTIVAPARGRIVSYRYAAGDQVSEGSELLHFEAEAQSAQGQGK